MADPESEVNDLGIIEVSVTTTAVVEKAQDEFLACACLIFITQFIMVTIVTDKAQD